jgi:HK97 family phage major capsid protein
VDTNPVQEARKTKLVEMRASLDLIDSQILGLADKEVLTEAEEETWSDLNAERDAIEPELRKLEDRAERVEDIKKKKYREIHGMPEIRKPVEELYFADVRKLDWRSARDGALRVLDDAEQTYVLNPSQLDHMDKTVRSNSEIARRVLVTENEHYRSAWFKLLRDFPAILTNEENQAVLRHNEFRAMAEGATTTGGFAIPVFIDPSVILTAQETDNPFLSIARVENISTNVWKGVSSAGVTWSFDTEAAEVSDDSPNPLAQPSVTVYMARGFIPFSIEVGEDWPGFQSEMARLLAAGYDEMLLDKFSRGSGTNEPRGLITALDANTNVEVVSTTDGTFGQEDIYKVWKSLPQKYRRKASWMMSVDMINRIRQFGAANVYHATTVTLEAAAVEALFNRPVYESPYFPDFTTTTGAENRLVVGDFSNYVIAKRSGMSVELVPHLLATANNLPSGSRGWFAYARIGGNSVNDVGFRLLQNQ